MQIFRRTVSSSFLRASIVTLILSSVLCAQNAPDKPSDKTAGRSPETVYKVGRDGVTAPRAVYAPDAEYSQEARQAKYLGTVILMATVSASGDVTDLKVVNNIGMGLDECAIKAVRNWKFKPGTKDGKPVAVGVPLEVEFHL